MHPIGASAPKACAWQRLLPGPRTWDEIYPAWSTFTKNELERSTILNAKITILNGKITIFNGKSPFLMGKSTISMVIFKSKLLNYQRVPWLSCSDWVESVETSVFRFCIEVVPPPPPGFLTGGGWNRNNEASNSVLLIFFNINATSQYPIHFYGDFPSLICRLALKNVYAWIL